MHNDELVQVTNGSEIVGRISNLFWIPFVKHQWEWECLRNRSPLQVRTYHRTPTWYCTRHGKPVNPNVTGTVPNVPSSRTRPTWRVPGTTSNKSLHRHASSSVSFLSWKIIVLAFELTFHQPSLRDREPCGGYETFLKKAVLHCKPKVWVRFAPRWLPSYLIENSTSSPFCIRVICWMYHPVIFLFLSFRSKAAGPTRQHSSLL
jgi:hypothetical protein